MPAQPLDHLFFPGDFFQIRNGELFVLGNIFRNGVIDQGDCKIGTGIKQNPANWQFSDGVSRPYLGRGVGKDLDGEFEYSKQLLAFTARGSFMFKGSNPESVKILNFNDLQSALIIKMTQTMFSFRELYIVTEVVAPSDWVLAVAGASNAELEIAADSGDSVTVDVFGHHKSRTIQSRDIEYYHHERNRKPTFFKAKKLVVQDERKEVFISDLLRQRMDVNQWARNFFDYDFHAESLNYHQMPANAGASVLDMLQANELNPNTALQYFRWGDANLDDIEKLFTIYGH